MKKKSALQDPRETSAALMPPNTEWAQAEADIHRALGWVRRSTDLAVAVLAEDGSEPIVSGDLETPARHWLQGLADSSNAPDATLAPLQVVVHSNDESLDGACAIDRSFATRVAISFPHPVTGAAVSLWLLDQRLRAYARQHDQTVLDCVHLMGSLLRHHAELRHQADVITRQEAALAHSRKIFERSSALTRIGVWECILDTEELHWTNAVYDMFDLPRGADLDRTRTLELYSRESREELERRRSAAIRERSGFTMDAEVTTLKGNTRWIRITATVETEDDRPVRIFGMKQDITEERLLSERTRYLAEFDVLTGLANRSQFQARLASMSDSSHGLVTGASMLLVDLDGFKQVNDNHGHAAGDECLKEIAIRLRELVHKEDVVARIGGDEFAVLTAVHAGENAMETLAKSILERLHPPIYWADQSFQLGASIGIAMSTAGTRETGSELFANADIALYAAKAAGKNTYRFFDPSMKSASELRLATIRNISAALARDELELFYQPKFRTDDCRLAGLEALMRWRLPNGQVLSAGAFQAAFEDPELSRRLGQWVIDRAISQAAEWYKHGLDFGHVAVNVSSSQFNDRAFADDLVLKIQNAGLQPGMLEIEITEGVFLYDEAGPIHSQLERLQAAGVRIALDDFGTGYASLVHLRSYPVDTIKIDKSFVQNFLTSTADATILESIIYLGLRLQKEVIAEGVETSDQFERLRALGCPLVQGFLFARPLPAAEVVAYFPSRAASMHRVA